MDAQSTVVEFIDTHDLDATPEYRLLDLVAEVGELAKDGATAADYGRSPEEFRVASDEIGDVLFALLAFADAVDVDAEAALQVAIAKYEARIDRYGSPASNDGE